MKTAQSLSTLNYKNEINIHNIRAPPDGYGYIHRVLSLMMILDDDSYGAGFSADGPDRLGTAAVPVFLLPGSSLRYAVLFVGACLWAKYYYPHFPGPSWGFPPACRARCVRW